MNRATVEEQNLAMEKATGDTSRSIMKRERSTRGVESMKKGWMREWRTVGMKRVAGQR